MIYLVIFYLVYFKLRTSQELEKKVALIFKYYKTQWKSRE